MAIPGKKPELQVNWKEAKVQEFVPAVAEQAVREAMGLATPTKEPKEADDNAVTYQQGHTRSAQITSAIENLTAEVRSIPSQLSELTKQLTDLIIQLRNSVGQLRALETSLVKKTKNKEAKNGQ